MVSQWPNYTDPHLPWLGVLTIAAEYGMQVLSAMISEDFESGMENHLCGYIRVVNGIKRWFVRAPIEDILNNYDKLTDKVFI